MSRYQPPELPLTQIPTVRTAGSQHNPVPTSSYHAPSIQSHYSSATQDDTPKKEKPDSFGKPAGRRRRQEESSSGTLEDEDTGAQLNKMGQLYERILKYGTGTHYSIYSLPVAVVILIPIIAGATQVDRSDPKIGGIRIVWFFTWIEAVWLTLWTSMLFARVVPGVFEYLAGVVSTETKRYARILENLRTTITILVWVIVSFILYEVLFSTASSGNTPGGWTKTFKQVMAAILISTIIFTIEKVFVQFISVSYHARSFNNRIDEVKRAVDLLAVLFDASREMFPMYQEFLDQDWLIHPNIETLFRKGIPGKRSSADGAARRSNHRIFRGIGRLGNKVNSVFGNIASELTGKGVLQPRSAKLLVIEALEKSKSSQALAQRLWYSFVMEGHDRLRLEDLEEVLGSATHNTAADCFHLLDPDENGDVSLEEITLKLTEVCIERKSIARSMHDVSQAIKALDNVLGSVAFLLSVFFLGQCYKICFLKALY